MIRADFDNTRTVVVNWVFTEVFIAVDDEEGAALFKRGGDTNLSASAESIEFSIPSSQLHCTNLRSTGTSAYVLYDYPLQLHPIKQEKEKTNVA